jgi:hypothetical protein
MTTCTSIQAARIMYGDAPRRDLPDWLRNPTTDDQFAHALAVLRLDLEPLCQDGLLVGFRGLGVAA